MSDIRDYGVLTLGSYLRKISDLLYREVDQIYASLGHDLNSRSVPCLLLIKDNGQVPITLLSEKLGQTHSAVSQMSKKLLAAGLIFDLPDSADERRRLVSLTPLGYEFLDKIERTLKHIQHKMSDMLHHRGDELFEILGLFERSQAEQPLNSRVIQSMAKQTSQTLQIVDYSPIYREAFKALNVEWLEKYFYVEAIDEKVLSHPEDYIIAPGGHIFIALLNNEPVGTVALIKDSEQRLELSKMAVTEKAQGFGVGRKLLKRALAFFRETTFETLFLESNSKLETAIQLYLSEGFAHKEKPGGESHYQRADVYMEYDDS